MTPLSDTLELVRFVIMAAVVLGIGFLVWRVLAKSQLRREKRKPESRDPMAAQRAYVRASRLNTAANAIYAQFFPNDKCGGHQ